MIDYIEFPDINAPTIEGRVQQLTEWTVKLQIKYNKLVEEFNKLKED